jgi:AcrR family transcriptional regulator
MLRLGLQPAVPDASVDRRPQLTVGTKNSGPARPPLAGQRGRKRTLLPAILRAATQLFAEHGFDQPTMDQIAAAAGVRKATLYAYFDGKSALVDAVIDRWLHEIPATTPAVRGSSLRQQLVEIGWQLHRLSTHPATVSLARRLDEMEHCLAPLQLQAWQRRYATFEDALTRLLEHRCACEFPEYLAHQFVLLSVGGLDSTHSPHPADAGERIERAVELVIRAYPERCARSTCATGPRRAT